MTSEEALKILDSHIRDILGMLPDDASRQFVATQSAQKLHDLANEASQRRTAMRNSTPVNRSTPYPSDREQAVNDAMAESHRDNWMLDAAESDDDYKTPVVNPPHEPVVRSKRDPR